MRDSIENSMGRSSGPGRPATRPASSKDFFRPTKMNPALYMMTFILHSLPDPDEIMAKGDLHYQDLYNLIKDGHVLSCIQQRKTATMAHQIRVEPRPDSSGPKSEQALKLCKRMVSLWSQGTRDFISQMLDALFMGMQPFELNWFWDGDVEGGGLICERPQDLFQEWFRYSPDGQLRYRPKPYSFTTEACPSFKVLNPRHMATLRNPYGVKLYSACYWPTTFKRGGFKFFAEYVEKFGMPMMDVEAPNSVSETDLRRYAAEVIAMARRGVMAHRSDYKVSVVDMETKFQTTDAFDKFIAMSDRENSKALLGQTLTTDEGGSRSQGDIHKQILEMLWKGDDDFVASTLSDLFDIVTFVNFGPDVVGPMAVVGEKMGNDRIDRDSKLRDMFGVDFEDDYLIRNYDLKKGDFKRTPPLKASYAADNAVRPREFSPSGTPLAGTEFDLVEELVPGGTGEAKSTHEPASRVSKKDGGARKSEASKTKEEARAKHRNRGSE